MNKPLNLRVEEAKEEIVQTINSTGLPFFLVEPIVKDIYNEIVILKQNELQRSRSEYDKGLKEEKNEKDESNVTDKKE